MTPFVRSLTWIGLGALLGMLLFAFNPAAHALPEYATRTGEPCATCHVNPAGGGPRTMRGSLWIAAGKPDRVPPLPGAQDSAPAAGTSVDGRTAYGKYGCSGCHGATGEGGAGPALNRSEQSAALIGQVVRNGRGAMAGLKPSVLGDADLAAIVGFVQAVGRGEVKAQASGGFRPLKPALAQCGDGPTSAAGGPALSGCGGN